jgi:hypothetical protein
MKPTVQEQIQLGQAMNQAVEFLKDKGLKNGGYDIAYKEIVLKFYNMNQEIRSEAFKESK